VGSAVSLNAVGFPYCHNGHEFAEQNTWIIRDYNCAPLLLNGSFEQEISLVHNVDFEVIKKAGGVTDQKSG
jgi:hypothetical protein